MFDIYLHLLKNWQNYIGIIIIIKRRVLPVGTVALYSWCTTTLRTSKYFVDVFWSADIGGWATTSRNFSRPATQCAATTATYCETAAPEHKTRSSPFRPGIVSLMVQGNSVFARLGNAKWRIPQMRRLLFSATTLCVALVGKLDACVAKSATHRKNVYLKVDILAITLSLPFEEWKVIDFYSQIRMKFS